MIYQISNIAAGLDDPEQEIRRQAAVRLGLQPSHITGMRIVKESVDARKKHQIHLVLSVLVETSVTAKRTDAQVRAVAQEVPPAIRTGSLAVQGRPVVVGTGPAGLFCALWLARAGYCPVVLERGKAVEERILDVDTFWRNGKPDPDSNVQFGEGGAGTFSDGKLTTRISDHRCDAVLRTLAEAGAPEEILWRARPHIGTDILRAVVARLRKEIISAGGEVRFSSRMTDIRIERGNVTAVVLENGTEIRTGLLVIAPGHSARDTFEMLHQRGVQMEAKAFSVGARIEHPQQMINEAQYGSMAGHPRLRAAEYALHHNTGSRTAYTFCMCPGGLVVGAASEPGTVVTNGMSHFARDRRNANSALVVSVSPDDFGNHPLNGIEFQRQWERLAFRTAGGTGAMPAQRVEDFTEGRATRAFGTVIPDTAGGTVPGNLEDCLPPYVTEAMREGLHAFDRKIRGFAMPDAVLTGVETRTSSPVRIPRGEDYQALGIEGLYPAGEGAGYAGGIMSAAVDGIRVAEAVMTKYAPLTNRN